MSTQVQDGVWATEKDKPFSQKLIDFCARRRIAISLIGFTSLVVFNLFVRRTIPHNPFDLTSGAVCAALALMAIGLAIRSWSAGTLNKSRELTMHGPYSITRNPLYIGSFLMMFAFCILCKDWPTLLFVAIPMTFLYRLQVLFEEKRLSNLFPEQWPTYYKTVPRFIPRWINKKTFQGWSRFEWTRNREYKTLLASLAGLLGIFLWQQISMRIW